MRLQVAIYRHTLPPVNIIFATGVGPSSNTKTGSSTIFNLLEDVNDLVPLESSDGEWGLEDYIVEVAATVDQETYYECLHYLPLKSVLREDDEVVVRALGSDDLKSWRRGGRTQITNDGRHLTDGVVFSKPWVRKDVSRPGVRIPPRKKRRLLLEDDEEEESEKENLEPERGVFPVLTDLPYDGSEDEDLSEDYDARAITLRETFEDADTSDDNLSDTELDGEELQLLLQDAADLENANNAEAVLDKQLKSRRRLGKRKRHVDDDGDAESDQEPTFEGFESPERTRVLRDLSSRFSGVNGTHDVFEADSPLEEVVHKQRQKVLANQLDDQTDEESDDEAFTSGSSSAESDASASSSSSESDTDHTSDSDSDISDESDSSDSSESTSSDESDSAPEADAHQSTGKAATKTDDPATKASENGPTASSTSSNAGNIQAQNAPDRGVRRTRQKNIRIKKAKRLSALKTKGLLPAHANFKDLAAYDAEHEVEDAMSTDVQDTLEKARQTLLAKFSTIDTSSNVGEPVACSIEKPLESVVEGDSPVVPETQQSRGRTSHMASVKLPELSSRTLEQLRLLEEPERAHQWLKCCFEASPGGSVSQDAMFVAYYRCFNEHGALSGSAFLPCVLKVFKNAHIEDPFDPYTAIKGLRARDTAGTAEQNSQIANSDTVLLPARIASEPDRDSVEITATMTSETAEPSPKRTKLDISASRRLIFGALGSRNPKTPAQAKAVQEKLAESARKPFHKHQATQPDSSSPKPVVEDVPWQEKLIVTAVECEQDGVTYPPPPFPFVQHWHRQDREKRRSLPSYHESEDSVPKPTSEINAGQPSAAKSVHIDKETTLESRTVSFEKDEQDGMPIPTDFDGLPDLQPQQALLGAIIAFKQLEVDMNSFEPKMSGYKVARITKRKDDELEVVLATRYRIANNSSQASEDDDSAYRNFVIREPDEADDGVRELDYSALNDAKLVQATTVQVPNSHEDGISPASDRREKSQEDSAIPESAPNLLEAANASLSKPDESIEMSSPRRHEISAIIREAGFDSTIGEHVLNPDLSSQDQNDGFNETREPAITKGDVSVIGLETTTSSPFFPVTNAYDAQHAVNADSLGSNGPPPTSSPPVSPQLTVDYPHLSHIDLGSDMPTNESPSRQSSSHQDAQRQTPLVEANTTLIASDQRDKMAPIDNEVMVGSDGAPSSQPDVDSASEAIGTDAKINKSTKEKGFLSLFGLDGRESSFHPSEDEDASDSEDSLPSLKELTSSQKRKIMTRASRATKAITPPAVKRGLRNTGKARNSSRAITCDSTDGLPRIKISASQQENGLSQIPLGSQVVDLTLSSDPVSPSGSDGEFEVQTSQTRTSNAHGASQGRSTRRAAAGRGVSDLGIGQKKMLTTKKTRSMV